MKEKRVSHEGVVKSVTDKIINVEIITKSACSECHAKMMCTASDMKVKNIAVKRRFYDDYKVGEQVKVSLTRTMGYKAVVISYLFPLIILTILLLYLQNTYQNELIAGLGSIAGVAVYYFFVWLLKDKLENKFSFTIEKL
ncbi:MAG: SoxR reducing system RseC family protein [Bacteroidales bacterium]|nr:SoxR reducing system RseC family protein [Bacteroidales bacterium]